MTFKGEGGDDYSGSLPRLPAAMALAAPLCRAPAAGMHTRAASADAQQPRGQAHGTAQAAEAHVADLPLMACAVACQ